MNRFFFLSFTLFLISCSALKIKGFDDSDQLKQETYDLFESEDSIEHEIFRVFLSSDDYIRKQLNLNDTIDLTKDPSGDESASKELIPYNKINFKAKVIVRVTIYGKTGTIAKIRFVRSSGISEIDKLISEDITRWKFAFPQGKVEPDMFVISFYVFLKNTINKEQAKIELKKYVD